MKPVILFRSEYKLESEKHIAQKYFELVENRALIKDSLVIGRYSVLPFFKELEIDLAINNSKLLNTLEEHGYIANFDYYQDLSHLTFKTWFNLTDIRNEPGPFILKGVTNSKKLEWSKFFAKDFPEAVRVYGELQNDSLIGNQQIIIRQFEPLKNYGVSLGGIPFANEWRFFFYQDTMLSYGFYWSGADNKPSKDQIDPAAIAFAKQVAVIAKEHVNFFVVDVAQKENGDWVLVELNDGSMSGLGDNDPDELYSNLKKALA